MFNGSELITALFKGTTACGVPYRPGATRPNMCSRSRFFGVPKRQSKGTRVAHAADRAALSIKELQAPILDDEAWLSDVQTSEKDARGGTLGNAKVEAESSPPQLQYMKPW
eukprot:3745738-Amphidinium_carterae.1